MILPDFTPNNVEFQLDASSAWSEFYKTREFLLNQIIISEQKFHPTCKEVFLLLFSYTRLWLINLEEDIKIIKFENTDEIREEMIDNNIRRLEKLTDTISKNITENEKYFDPGYSKVMLVILKEYRVFLNSQVKRNLKKSIENNFHDIVKFTIHLMNHFLHILYELDYLYFADRKDKNNFLPFISLDTVDVNLYKERKISLVNTRLTIYREHDLIETDAYWTLKSYCNRRYLDSDFTLSETFEKLLSDIESHDIRVACIM